jgi:hypothetical protein
MNNTLRPSRRCGSLLPLAFVCGALSLLAAGCGKTKDATVSGKVTYHGQPVTGGSLTLHPTDGGPDYPVTLNPDGTFQVAGAPLGEMKVTVETESLRNMPAPGSNPYGNFKLPPGQKPEAPPPSTEDMGKYVKIPRKYQDVKTTPLTWTLKKGSEIKDFDLTD